MFPVPSNSFNWRVDNFGATLSDAGFGTSVVSGASHVKGSAVSLIAGASVTEDVYGIGIVFAGGALSAATRNFLADLLIDPAGGTSWSTLIANMAVRAPSFVCGGYNYYFPLYLESGTAIGMQQQCSTTGAALRAGVRLFGKPTRPELLRVGSKTQTYGASTATSAGTAFTPGTNAQGSYSASLGTVANFDQFWWQAGMGMNDTTGGEKSYLLDVAAGDASNKRLVIEHMQVATDENEQCGKAAMGLGLPQYDVPIGENIYMRGWASTTPDSSITGVVIGVG